MWQEGWNAKQKGKKLGKEWSEAEADMLTQVAMTAAERRKLWWAMNGRWAVQAKAESSTGLPGLDAQKQGGGKKRKSGGGKKGGAWRQAADGTWEWFPDADETSAGSGGPGVQRPLEQEEPQEKKQKQDQKLCTVQTNI